MDLFEVGSHVRDVTIFRQGAEVIRVAELAAQEGRYSEWVQLGGLPLSLDDDSLRARVVGEGEGVAPLAADLRVELEVEPADREPPLSAEARERLRELDREQHRLNSRADYLKRCFERLAALEPRPRPGGTHEAPADSPLEPRRKLIEFRQRELARLHEQGREVDAELAKLAREREALLPKKLATSRGALTKRVLVRLKTPAGKVAPRARLELSYRTPGARWAPAYAFRLDRDLTMVDVLMRVVVCQATGEDWKRVRMSVSTADPMGWKELPELPSWRIGKRQQAPAKQGWRPAPTDTETLFADYDRARKVAPSVVMPELEPEPEPVYEMAPAADPFGGTGDPFGAAESGWLGGAEEVGDVLRAKSAAPLARRAASVADVRVDMLPATRARSGLLRTGAGSGKPMLSRSPAPPGAPPPPPPPPRAAPERPQYLGSSNWGAPEPELEVGREYLAYGSLRMPAAYELGRGKLRPQDLVEAAHDQLRRRGEETDVNLRAVIDAAHSNAHAVARMAVLPGHRAPQAVEGFDYLYPGDGLVDLPSDAQFHSLPLLVRSLPARTEFVTVPRVTADVFRMVEIDCLPDLALPLGPTDVYVGDDFLIATLLKDTPPGGTIRLGLGVEQQIKVARNATYKETTAGMMGGTAQLRHTVTIDLNNRLEREALVQVQERLPEPAKGQDDIKVKIEEVSPNWESFVPPERPELKSAYRWQVKVEPRSRLSLKVTYLIEIPSKQELQGGNRREA